MACQFVVVWLYRKTAITIFPSLPDVLLLYPIIAISSMLLLCWVTSGIKNLSTNTPWPEVTGHLFLNSSEANIGLFSSTIQLEALNKDSALLLLDHWKAIWKWVRNIVLVRNMFYTSMQSLLAKLHFTLCHLPETQVCVEFSVFSVLPFMSINIIV